MPLCQRAARRLRRTRRPIRKNPPPQARTRAAPSVARSSPSAAPAAGGQKTLLRGGYLRPNDGARLCTRSVGPRKPPSKHSAYVRTSAKMPSQRQARPHGGKAALVNQRRLHTRGGHEARIRLLHLPLPYFLTAYARRTGNAAKAGHMRAKARLPAFKKRFSSYGIRQPAARLHISGVSGGIQRLTPARRHGGGKRGGRPPKPSRQQRAGRCGGAQRRLIRRGEQPVNIDCAGGIARSETSCQRAPRQRFPYRAAYGRRYAEYAFHPAARKKRRMHCKFSFFPP